jgi:hypothetical protein
MIKHSNTFFPNDTVNVDPPPGEKTATLKKASVLDIEEGVVTVRYDDGTTEKVPLERVHRT